MTLPDGSVLYTRRDAHDIIQLNPTTGAKTNLGTVPNVQSTDGEGGLLGLAISASYASDHWLYIMHTSPTDNRIVRIRLDERRDSTPPASRSCSAASGVTSSTTVVACGSARTASCTPAPATPRTATTRRTGPASNGKILRLNPDGTVPSDNPFGNYVWSYGHRNPQGLAFDSQGRLWEQEFGNSVMDETNLITKGGNYGWPACEGTSGACGTAGFIAPKRTYPTAEGLLLRHRDRARRALRGLRARRSDVPRGDQRQQPDRTCRRTSVGTYGRLRTVEPAPDGGLWLTTTNVGDKDSTPNNSNERILHVTLGN